MRRRLRERQKSLTCGASRWWKVLLALLIVSILAPGSTLFFSNGLRLDRTIKRMEDSQ